MTDRSAEGGDNGHVAETGSLQQRKRSRFSMGELRENFDTSNPTAQTTWVGKYYESQCCGFPTGVYMQIGSELCERFSYYGMKAILTLYFLNVMGHSQSTSTLLYHAFVMVAYFTPILGSILADGWLGRYAVELYGSWTYVIGHVLMTISAWPEAGEKLNYALDYLGLIIIGISTGAIKPVASALAADQFKQDQKKEIARFFAFWYFAINVGSMISIVVTPILRSQVKCFGHDSCYALAFGLPAVLMFLSTIIFIIGKPFYIIHKPTGRNVILEFCSCTWLATRKRVKELVRFKFRVKDRESFFDLALEKYDRPFIDDVRQLWVVTKLLLPLIGFWALFDQQGSTWIFQANEMDGNVGKLSIIPDQMPTVNPLFVLILIPLFESVIYPLMDKNRFLGKDLTKVGLGGCLAAIAFLVGGFLQLAIDPSNVKLPEEGTSRYVVNNMIAQCKLKLIDDGETIDPFDYETLDLSKQPQFTSNCTNVNINLETLNLTGQETGTFVNIFGNPNISDAETVAFQYKLEKTRKGKMKIMFIGINVPKHAFVFATEGMDEDSTEFEVDLKEGNSSEKVEMDIQKKMIGERMFRLHYKVCKDKEKEDCTEQEQLEHSAGEFDAEMGSAYVMILQFRGNKVVRTEKVQIIEHNKINMLWQTPQYFIITVGEVLLSIKALEFSYTQASPALKSVLQGNYLMTVAFGQVIAMGISGSGWIKSTMVQFFTYAGLMFAVMLWFLYLAWTYIPVKEYSVSSKHDLSVAGEAKQLTDVDLHSEPEENEMEEVPLSDRSVDDDDGEQNQSRSVDASERSIE